MRVIVIGGGAAGMFGAVNCALMHPCAHVTVLEATRRLLTKVLISGGGRCNVTHDVSGPAELIQGYPRGSRELRGPFNKFQPKDTVAWFAARGVTLKTEADGRMFPTTDDAKTIAGCLERAAADAGVEIKMGASVQSVARGFTVTLKDGTALSADRILLATGSAPAGHEIARSLGHTITPLVPSLFTFNVKDPRLADLAGVSFPHAALSLKPLVSQGPLLITHWGLSGPAVLRLSAFGAQILHDTKYHAELTVSVLPDTTPEAALAAIRAYKDAHPRQSVGKNPVFAAVPRRFWARLAESLGLAEDFPYADLSKAVMQRLADELTRGKYQITGKGVFKDEFVTAGGVALTEVDFRTLESKICPGLHFAGEVLDVDGVTGGYNFQAAWTTSYLAASAMAP